jgi:cell division protein ZapA (FtsZ GTPase activity inhibitor)
MRIAGNWKLENNTKMDKSKTRIKVLGEDFYIRTDKDDKYVAKVLDLLQLKIRKIREMAGEMGNMRIAILAGILLAEDVLEIESAARETVKLVKAKPEGELEEEIAAITSRLIDDLDDIMRQK